MSEPYAAPEAPEPVRSKRPVALILAVVAALLLVVGVIVAVAGKDDGGPDTSPIALLTGAPDAVRDAKSARMTMAMTLQAGTMDVELTGDGAVEFATSRAHFSMSVLRTDIELLSDGETAYMRIADGGTLPGISKPWVAFPAKDMRSQGVGFSGVESATGMLDALRGIGGTVDELGTDEVNGVKATHYHAVVNMKDAIANAPEAQRAQAEAALEQFDQLGAAEMPVDVWVSDDGLPVRQIITFDGAEGSVLGPFSMKIQIDLSDFGAPVEVQVPPADQVQRIEDPAQLGQLFGGVPG